MIFTSASRLVHPIVIQQRTRTQSTSGEIVEQWTDALETWAEVKPLRGRNVEIAAARTKGRVTSHQITMRVPPVPMKLGTTRIQYRSQVYELFDIDDVNERGIELDILANVSEL